MKIETIADIGLCICFFIVGFVVAGIMLGNEFQKQAVSHQAAHYDSQTGKFTWNDEKGTK